MSSPDLITIVTSDGDVELFVGGDIYRYDVDNRPLRNLILNDQALQTGANLVIEEVYEARTNTVPFSYGSLKARLDDMDLLSGQAAKTNIFSQIQDRAALYRAQFASGFFIKTGDIYDPNIFDVVSSQSVHIPYGAICVKDRNTNDVGSNLLTSVPSNSVWLSTHAGTKSPYIPKPIEAMLGGYHVRLFNESANGAAAAGFSNGVSVLFNAAPATGSRYDLAFLEFWFATVDKGLANTGATDSFYEYGAVDSNNARSTDQSAPAVQGTVWFDPATTGNYVQIRHRIRVVNGVDYASFPFGMNDATVVAQGGAGSPVAGKVFSNGLSVLGDPAIWVAGSGSGGDKTALGTIDGRVYGIPLMIVARKNTSAWSLTNQNGGSGRPDGYTHDQFSRGDIIDLRPRAFTDRNSIHDIADETFDRVLRGRLLTAFGNLAYETGTNLGTFGDATNAFGTELLEVNYLGSTATSHTHPIRDFDDSGTLGLAKPTGFRRVFSPSRDDELVGFHINLNGGATTPSDFVQWNSGTRVITLDANGSSNNGPANAKLNSTPILIWRTSHAPVALVSGWSGIGSLTATATVDNGDSFYDPLDTIDGSVAVEWPRSTALRHSPNRVEYQDYQSPTSAVTDTVRATGLAGGTGGAQGPTGLFVAADGHMYVCDTSNHRVLRYDSTFTIDGQFPGSIGSLPGAGSDNAHLNGPQGISVDGSGNIFVADTNNHRVVKISPSMTYLSQFGFTGVSAGDNTHCSFPQGVHAGVSNVYVSDTGNYRIIKLNSSLAYVDQFGTTGVQGSDNSHCMGPARMTAGVNRLIVADQTRVLILNSSPSPMVLDRVLVGGQGYQDGSPITALNAIKSLNYAEDSSGNKYVSGGGTSAIYKFDSSYQFVARFGSGSNDLTGLWTGPNDPNAHVHCGLPRNIAIDEGNGLLYVADNTFGIQPQFGRVLILNLSDLTYNSEYLVTNPRPWMDGSAGLPKHPTPPYATADVNIALDVSGQKLYILLDIFGTVEQWNISASPTNSSLWSYVTKFGSGTYSPTAFGNFTAWRSNADDTKRLSYPQTLTLSQDGTKLYVADQSLPKILTGHYASRVVRLTTSTMACDGWMGDLNVADTSCDLGNTTDTPYFQYVTGITCLDSTNDRVYVSDAFANPPLLVVLQHTGTWAGRSSPFKEAITDSSWVSARIPAKPNDNNYLSVNGSSYDHKVLFINPGFFTQRWAIDTSVVTAANADTPTRTYLSLSGSVLKPIQSTQKFIGVTGVWYDSTVTPNRLAISDQTNNEVFIVSVGLDKNSLPADFTLLGEAGTAGVSAFGFGGWAHPTSVAIKQISGVDYFYYTDFFNGSLQRSSPYFAFVERGTGRVESLLAPPAGSNVRIYSRYTPYQGVYTRPDLLGNASHGDPNYTRSLFASRLVTKPYKMLATTLGRVGIDNGMLITETAYASPLTHLPLPAGSTTEYDWIGDPLVFGDLIDSSSLVYLPIVQMGSQPQEWESDSESFYERTTRIGLGQANLSHGGMSSYSRNSNEFPVVRSFSLSGPQPHINYTWGVIDYYGEMLLFVRGDLNITNKNVVGERINPYVQQQTAIEVYRMAGNPFVKFLESRG